MSNLEGQYPPIAPALVQCARCGAVLVDAPEPRRVHDRHHEHLRLLWERTGGPRHDQQQDRPAPASRRPATVGARRRHERS